MRPLEVFRIDTGEAAGVAHKRGLAQSPAGIGVSIIARDGLMSGEADGQLLFDFDR